MSAPVGADAKRSCSRRKSVTDAACPLRVLIGLKVPSTKRGLLPQATGGEIPAAADSLPLCKGSLWVLCLIVFCLSCILAEKFSFQREDGEYSDLRSRNLRFLRPRPTFSWSPTMAPFRANSIAIFGRSLSRTAPGEWLENLCSFILGSVPKIGPRPEITRLQMRIKL